MQRASNLITDFPKRPPDRSQGYVSGPAAANVFAAVAE
jgi:hypothetical protein